MKRLRLVQLPIPQPAAHAATGNVPLAAGCLAVSARVHGLVERGLELDVVPPAITDTYGDTLLADYIARDEPDFVGLSLYLWNVERSLHLAREIRRRSPHTRILIGGPEVNADNPFVLSQSGFDIAITGEAEDTFGLVMGHLLDGRDVTGLPGVATRRGLLGLGPFGPPPRTSFPLTDYPSPYLEGLLPVEGERSTYLETVRGCRSHCTYCFYPRSSNVLRVLDVARSAALVAALRERGARELVFLDPTFNHRPDFEALLVALATVNGDGGLSCFAEVRAEGLTREHARALARAGFTKLEMGLQSINRETLKRVKRGGNPEKVAAAARMLRDEGIDLLVDLMIGLPGDTPDDVARGLDFLMEHELHEHAQVFLLSLLPGTALRASALADGVEYEPAPPYRVTRTATFDTEALGTALFAAEARLGRRLDEQPRPYLAAQGQDPQDVIIVDVDDPRTLTRADRASAQHCALWLVGRDLFTCRERALHAVELRMKRDPFATLDVVLAPELPFPLDMIDLLRACLQRGTPSYATRALALRGEDLQRRIAVVLRATRCFPEDWVLAVRRLAPVFREQSMQEATEHGVALGDTRLSARILDEHVEQSSWQRLAREADPAAVSFANRRYEAAWVRQVLRYDDARTEDWDRERGAW